MLNKLSNVLQCSAVTIALCFLILPYAYAHDTPFHPLGDADGDGINNKTDVCVESLYGHDYHEQCLTEAGLLAPEHYEIVYQNGGGSVHPLHLRIPVMEEATFYNLRIQTCKDLTDYRNEMSAKVREWKNYRWLVRVIGAIAVILILAASSGLGGVAAGVITAIILAAIDGVITMYEDYADSADDAYVTLNCGRR